MITLRNKRFLLCLFWCICIYMESTRRNLSMKKLIRILLLSSVFLTTSANFAIAETVKSKISQKNQLSRWIQRLNLNQSKIIDYLLHGLHLDQSSLPLLGMCHYQGRECGRRDAQDSKRVKSCCGPKYNLMIFIL